MRGPSGRDALTRLLLRTRRALNGRIALDAALGFLAPAAAILALLLAALRLLTALGPAALPDRLFLAAWLLGSCLAAAAGALLSARRRLRLAETAAWLDAALRDDGLFSAGLDRLEAARREGAAGETGAAGEAGAARGPETFAELVLERATRLAGETEAARPRLRPRPGYTRLGRRAAVAGLACLASAAILAFAGPGARRLAMTAALRGGLGAYASAGPAGGARGAEPGSPAALARALFPEDRAMGDRAERALRAGRLDEFRGLLRRAEAELDAKLERAAGRAERSRLGRERDRLAAAAGGLGGAPSGGLGAGRAASGALPDRLSESESGAEAEARSRSGGDRDGEEPPASRRSKPGAGPEDARPGSDPRDSAPGRSGPGGAGPEGAEPGGERNGQGGSGSGSVPGGKGPARGGSAPGFGTGSPRDWGPIEPRATGGVAAIAPDAEAPFHVFVLPERKAAAGEAGSFAAAGRAAEAAVRRVEAPLEYEEFVGAYFLALTGDAAAGGEQGGAP